jgi:DeoR family transcriptional regulator, copper-sensing transcriptional repressor
MIINDYFDNIIIFYQPVQLYNYYMNHLSDRQSQLYEWLEATKQLQLTDIQDRFNISVSTAYREIRVLLEAGLVIKTKRGIRISPALSGKQSYEQCCHCGGMLNDRVSFIIQLIDGGSRSTCCAHCGLMSLNQPNIQSALTSDFLYGRMINVVQGYYILKSSVSLCCEPSVLSFATENDALRFQTGFGGIACNLDQAILRLNKWMEIK